MTVSPPTPVEPGEWAAGHAPGHVALQVTVTVANRSGGLLDLSMAHVAADGAEAVYDSANGLTADLPASVPAHGSASGRYTFSLPARSARRLTVSAQPDLIAYDEATWGGPAA
ncbi:hypothetical protein BIV57_19125 [Mangrovactinospora gilvigrisea]|uniref:DUF4352 domain-containing protein n=1 Tax=Mangrovactinospora gilvigrisea TaxID=1428644 RepID=A0A1J7BBB2_9ACTN|nr:hypothetical protein BIV57_19125 [Mangrovactinospora gilvigrisea]